MMLSMKSRTVLSKDSSSSVDSFVSSVSVSSVVSSSVVSSASEESDDSGFFLGAGGLLYRDQKRLNSHPVAWTVKLYLVVPGTFSISNSP